MELNEYQRLANQTDQQPENENLEADPRSIMIPLLGMAGEVGELLGEHKKWLRDGESYKLFPERVKEELGGPALVPVQCCHQARADTGGGCRFQPLQNRQALVACGCGRSGEKAFR